MATKSKGTVTKRAAPIKRVAKATVNATLSGSSAAPLERQIEQSVRALWHLELSELETLIGQQLVATGKELPSSPYLTAANPASSLMQDRTQLAAAPVWLKKLGERFVQRFSAEMYSLVCNKDDPDNAKIVQAGAESAEKLALVLSGTLVIAFGWLPAIATAVGVIIAKRAFKGGLEALCSVWKESLPA